MTLPNMSSTLLGWTQSVSLKTATTTTVDFVPTTSIASQTIQAVIQPAQKEVLAPAEIDWSLNYITVHSVSQIDIGQYIEYNGVNYKVVQILQYGDYGYYEVVGEEVKGNIR